MKLKSIEEELVDCRAALAHAKVGDACVHIHHADGLLVEGLTEPAENRIQAILEKPVEQQARRLRAFRPWRGSLTPEFIAAMRIWAEARRVWIEANYFRKVAYRIWIEAARVYSALPQTLADHDAQCPDCTWNGKTLFPKENP